MICINNQKRKKHLWNMIAVLFLLMNVYRMPLIDVFAASASVYFESEETTVRLGSTVLVNLCIDAEETLGDFDGLVSYPSDKLRFNSNSVSVTDHDGVLHIQDMGASSVNTRIYALHFEVIGTGAIELQVTGLPEAYEYETKTPMSVSSLNYSMTAIEETKPDENTFLETLNISPALLTPEFQQEVMEYQVNVAADVERLIISAVPADLTSHVHITGNENLKAGNNRIQIQVTTALGATRDYFITVTKDELDETAQKINNEKEFMQKVDAVQGEEGIVLKGQYYYKVLETYQEEQIPDGYEKISFLLDGHLIPAYQKTSDTNGDHYLLYLKNAAAETFLYRYDRVEKTIQRLANNDISIINKDINSGEINEVKALVMDYQTRLKNVGLIIALLSALCGMLLIGLIHYMLKSRGYQDDDF